MAKSLALIVREVLFLARDLAVLSPIWATMKVCDGIANHTPWYVGIFFRATAIGLARILVRKSTAYIESTGTSEDYSETADSAERFIRSIRV